MRNCEGKSTEGERDPSTYYIVRCALGGRKGEKGRLRREGGSVVCNGVNKMKEEYVIFKYFWEAFIIMCLCILRYISR